MCYLVGSCPRDSGPGRQKLRTLCVIRWGVVPGIVVLVGSI